MYLMDLGWNDRWTKQFSPYAQDGLLPARVAAEHTHIFTLFAEQGEILAQVTGKLRYEAASREDYPAVGDWVAYTLQEGQDKALIHAILPRTSKFSRQVAGSVIGEQVLAANIDIVFLVNALNNDFNPRRIERYLTLAWESGAIPVIVLTKIDLCPDTEQKMLEIQTIAPGTPVHAISVLNDQGLGTIKQYLKLGRTVVLLGSSGVGKSTLINHLIGHKAQEVRAVREVDGRGRHTTTNRQMFLLPGGGLVIDTPGLRELQLWGTGEGLEQAFEDINEIADRCRFTDCQHQNEPGCAVQQALIAGELSRDRFDSYLKLQKELAFLRRKTDQQACLEEKKRWKQIHKQIRAMYKR